MIGQAAFQLLQNHCQVAADRVGIIGLSLGCYITLRIATLPGIKVGQMILSLRSWLNEVFITVKFHLFCSHPVWFVSMALWEGQWCSWMQKAGPNNLKGKSLVMNHVPYSGLAVVLKCICSAVSLCHLWIANTELLMIESCCYLWSPERFFTVECKYKQTVII